MTQPVLGVVIVSYNSRDVIFDCLESLLAARDVSLHVVVVDNASTDGTPAAIRDWAAGQSAWTAPDDLPFPLTAAPKPLELAGPDDLPPAAPGITLLHSPVNGGFAAGVNIGLAHLARHPDIDRFWVLNPDCVTPPETPRAFAAHETPGGQFSLLGGRLTYVDPPDRIQSDGGIIDQRTGRTHNLNLEKSFTQTPPSDSMQMDFISGASMVASRRFYETAGPMPEEYFLYYEEVDWALRRGELPLAFCPEARVYHRAGTAIGSPVKGRMASTFSLYFKHRARHLFVRRHFPRSLPTAWAFTLAKAGWYLLKGHRSAARTVIAGAYGAPPPREVREKLSPEARAILSS